jgi:hypothetical protein
MKNEGGGLMRVVVPTLIIGAGAIAVLVGLLMPWWRPISILDLSRSGLEVVGEDAALFVGASTLLFLGVVVTLSREARPAGWWIALQGLLIISQVVALVYVAAQLIGHQWQLPWLYQDISLPAGDLDIGLPIGQIANGIFVTGLGCLLLACGWLVQVAGKRREQ